MKYMKRAVDYSLKTELETVGAVLLEGPRACGKTETGLNVAKSSFRLDHAPNQALVTLNPSAALSGETPRLIDEWQLAPEIWNEIRHEVDARRKSGQFILSGSATPADDITRHTGAGRFARLRMRPMTLGEMHSENLAVTIEMLMHGTSLPAKTSPLTYDNLASAAVRGGWPAMASAPARVFMRYSKNYIENIAHAEMSTARDTDFSPERVRRLLRSIARNISSEVTATTLAADISADGGSLSPATVRTYLDALSQIFIVEELPAWSGSLRSKSRLRQQPRLHLCDPSLACAALQVSPESLALDPEYFGQVFESMAVRDLRTYADQIDAHCFAYRDNTGLEADLIMEFFDGSWAGFEMKLGEAPATIREAEKNLLHIAYKRMKKEPAFLAVITGGRNLYTLPSGVHVIPLALLGPLQ